MTTSILDQIQQLIIDGEDEELIKLVQEALHEGIKPIIILNDGLIKGIGVVGEEYQKGNFFLPDLILGAKAMEAGMSILQPLLIGDQAAKAGRKLIIGTVEGDLHDIGKTIVATMFRANGFEVYDLGVDVPNQLFIEKTRELKPDIIGLSALLTTTVGKQKDFIETLIEEGLRDSVKIMVGGAPISKEWADQIGADAYASDAAEAVIEAKRFFQNSW
jgi:corrinoid protein of di/trimethylamine methyltransferase